MANEWYLIQNKKKIGPIDETELRARLKQGQLNPSTMVWQTGMPEPVALGSTPIMVCAPNGMSLGGPPPYSFAKNGGARKVGHGLRERWPLIAGLAGLSVAVVIGIVVANKHWRRGASSQSARQPASESWFSGPSKAEMDADANIVCHAYSAQANAVNAFNQYISLCNSGNYSDCDSYTASSYRSNVDTLKGNFQQQDQAFYNKYGFTFSDRYNCY